MKFFISRAGEDSQAGQWIASVLESEGHSTILQDADFKSGSFIEHMQHALDSSDRFIAVLSPNYLSKEFTKRELHSAIAGSAAVIPVRVAECTLPIRSRI